MRDFPTLRPFSKAQLGANTLHNFYEIQRVLNLEIPVQFTVSKTSPLPVILRLRSSLRSPWQLMPNGGDTLLGSSSIGEVRPTNRHGHFFVFLLHETERRGKIHPLRRRRISRSRCPTGDKVERPLLQERGLCDPLARRIGNPSTGERVAYLVRNFRAVERTLRGGPSTQLSKKFEADMGKLKMKISKAELEATKKKKKDKQAAAKGGASSASDKGQERPTLNVVVEPSSLPIAIPSGDSPPPKRPRRSSPPAPAQDKGKEKQTTSMLGLEDSSTIRSDSSLVGPIVDSLMTRHDRSLLREMTLDEVGLEAAKCLKPRLHQRRGANKARRQPQGQTNRRRPLNGRRWKVVVDQKRSRRIGAGSPRTRLRQVGRGGAAKVARWPRAKKYIYKKAAIDAILKNTNDMIKAFKAGQTEDWVTPDPSDEEEDGQEDLEITSGEDEPDEGDAPPVNQP
ncbi:hypothetical protein FNV43_RR04313 [Rhamnella rubrinervis]|uniref:Uncharacterized protein n=1 Tax=Rhamnella rubrinervis TaxID=2594499 RepID=A0A8K0HJC0_9ROSA|nr:hypothetical protein FNV43_RR04313 [Rhamnella rubrinervis]